MTLQSLARTIAKARHGTDAMWTSYMGAAEAVAEWAASIADEYVTENKDQDNGEREGYWLACAAKELAVAYRSIIAPPSGAQ